MKIVDPETAVTMLHKTQAPVPPVGMGQVSSDWLRQLILRALNPLTPCFKLLLFIRGLLLSQDLVTTISNQLLR